MLRHKQASSPYIYLQPQQDLTNPVTRLHMKFKKQQAKCQAQTQMNATRQPQSQKQMRFSSLSKNKQNQSSTDGRCYYFRDQSRQGKENGMYGVNKTLQFSHVKRKLNFTNAENSYSDSRYSFKQIVERSRDKSNSSRNKSINKKRQQSRLKKPPIVQSAIVKKQKTFNKLKNRLIGDHSTTCTDTKNATEKSRQVFDDYQMVRMSTDYKNQSRDSLDMSPNI